MAPSTWLIDAIDLDDWHRLGINEGDRERIFDRLHTRQEFAVTGPDPRRVGAGDRFDLHLHGLSGNPIGRATWIPSLGP